jgi:HAD superfamily hydrolase (TIGR01509 family)
MLANCEAFIFDLDGTLVDSMWIWKQIDIDYLKKYGVELPENLQYEIEGMSFTETAHYFKERFGIDDDIESIKAEWNNMAADLYENEIRLKSGAAKLVKLLSERGLRLGIGTSNFRALTESVLHSNGIYAYFDVIRTSCEVPRGKPSPDIYLKVAEELKIATSKCVVFEDTYAGVLAAKRAGMKACAVYDAYSKTRWQELIELSDMHVESMDEIDIDDLGAIARNR